MSHKAIFLTLLLTIGFSFQHCTKDKDPFGCGCSSENLYFNINGMEVFNALHYNENIEDGHEISRQRRIGIKLLFQYKTVSQLKETNGSNFSLINSCYACTCKEPGDNGSKKEKWKSLNFITLYNYNNKYKVNDTINDILYIPTTVSDISQLWNIEDSNPRVGYHTYYFDLISKPSTNTTKFKAKVVVELTNGEVYEAETNTIIFK